VGETEDAAKDALRNAGFNVKVTERPAKEGETPGRVDDQRPGAGKQAVKGSTVEIVVLTEPEPTDSPSPSPSPTLTTPFPGEDAARRD
jgi:Uncharacterized protein conserved in bacteria